MTAETMPVRADLLALDAEALAVLTNRGLVKRAGREAGREPPEISPGPESTVVAVFSDGVRAELPVGGLELGRCTCGAVTVCRHLIGLVFAYQAVAAPGSAKAGQAEADGGLVSTGTGRAGADGGPVSAGTGQAEADGGPVSAGTGQAEADGGPVSAGAGQVGAGVGPVNGEAGQAGAGIGPASADVVPEALAPRTAAAAAEVDAAASKAGATWSPGGFTDEDLVARIGARLVASARRTLRTGFTARIRRGATPVVELASATVRFLVPHALGFVHTDARAGVRDDVIALAVWAFRAADAEQPDAAECVVDVGGGPSGAASGGSGLEAVVEFAAEVLRAGVVHAGDGLSAAAAGHLVRLERAGLRWPLDATAELAGQLAAYRRRSARYAPETTADLIAELFARHRAVLAGGSAGVRARVLGSEEAAQTPLRRVRLDGLGARVTAVDDERRVEIFHAHPASGVVLVSHREWTAEDDGPALSRRRFGGATVGALAAGVVITESAIRSASRAVRVTTGRVARSTVTVSSGAWADLPPSLLVTDFARAADEWEALPPRPVRARVRAELVRVLAVAEVCGMRYTTGDQRLTVEIRDSAGTPAFVVATHASVAPGRLDAVAAAFSGRHGTPRFVAGSVHRSGGGLVIDPYAIAADGPPIVPDLANPDPAGIGLTPQEARLAPISASDPTGLAPQAGCTPASMSDPAGLAPQDRLGAGSASGSAGVASQDRQGPGSASGSAGLAPQDRLGAGSASEPAGVGAGIAPQAGRGPRPGIAADPLGGAIAEAQAVLAEMAHTGLAHLPASATGRLRGARDGLARVGLRRVAAALDVLAGHLGPDPGGAATEAWVDAYLRVSTAQELL
ncbi:hypothetical protein AB0F81_42460 [Actinoplanes sp. NPDC024001]|uniref:hypothetical protein n=1 Tax=Actinoplanes sp. NPDC024001 TaxID=3154598 RepID=UPI0033F99822